MSKHFNFQLDENGRPVDPNRVVCLLCAPRYNIGNGLYYLWLKELDVVYIIVNIDILYRCANKVSCKIQIELLLPIYMTNVCAFITSISNCGRYKQPTTGSKTKTNNLLRSKRLISFE